MTDTHNGSCLCGKVDFTVKGELRDVLACHCGQCRKQTGLYYAATDAKLGDIEINGEESITWYEASNIAKRGFCSACGSALFWKHNELDRISILAGAFDEPTGLQIVAHIYCKDKGDFYTLEDELPKYDGESDEFFDKS